MKRSTLAARIAGLALVTAALVPAAGILTTHAAWAAPGDGGFCFEPLPPDPAPSMPTLSYPDTTPQPCHLDATASSSLALPPGSDDPTGCPPVPFGSPGPTFPCPPDSGDPLAAINYNASKSNTGNVTVSDTGDVNGDGMPDAITYNASHSNTASEGPCQGPSCAQPAH